MYNGTMSHNKIPILFLFVIVAFFASGTPASILDLISLDLEDKSEATQRKESSNEATSEVCDCDGSICKCCIDFDMVFIDFGGPACVHMKYVSQEAGIAVNVTYGGSNLHQMEIKGPNPNPSCMTLLEDIAEVCTKFTNVRPIKDGFTSCLEIQPKLLGQVQTNFDLGCFTIGSEGMKMDKIDNITQDLAISLSNLKKNDSKSESDEFNEEELIAAVNETAEQGLAFFGDWLGFFGKPDVNQSNTESAAETNTSRESSSGSRKSRLFQIFDINII